MRSTVSQHQRDPQHQELHTGNGHTVAQRFVAGSVRGTGDICPAIREALQPFALDGHQTPDQQRQVEDFDLRLVIHQIRGVLVLPRALGAGDFVRLEDIRPLAAEHGVAVGGGQRVGDVLVDTEAVSAVLRLCRWRFR